MYYFIYTSLLILFTACAPHHCSLPEVSIANDIMRSNNRWLAERGFYQYMTTGPCFAPIRKISAGYITKSYKFTCVDDARKFMCTFYSEYSRPFNEAQGIRHYLREYPLGPKHFRLYITFLDANKDSLNVPYIEYITLIDGKISYMTYTEEGRYSVLLEETVEEAMKKLAEQGEAEEVKR